MHLIKFSSKNSNDLIPSTSKFRICKQRYFQRMLFAEFTNEMLTHKLVLQLLGLEPRPLPLAIMTQTLWSAVPSFSRADLALNYPSPFSP